VRKPKIFVGLRQGLGAGVWTGMPEPSEDVDVCYRFFANLSRKIGQVQFFAAKPNLHHCLGNGERGRVVGLIWAGATIWQQGRITTRNTQLHWRCSIYLEP